MSPPVRGFVSFHRPRFPAVPFSTVSWWSVSSLPPPWLNSSPGGREEHVSSPRSRHVSVPLCHSPETPSLLPAVRCDRRTKAPQSRGREPRTRTKDAGHNFRALPLSSALSRGTTVLSLRDRQPGRSQPTSRGQSPGSPRLCQRPLFTGFHYCYYYYYY